MLLTEDTALRTFLRINETTIFVKDQWGSKHELPYLEFVTDDRSPNEIDWVIARLDRENIADEKTLRRLHIQMWFWRKALLVLKAAQRGSFLWMLIAVCLGTAW